jgi:hypothetical protein
MRRGHLKTNRHIDLRGIDLLIVKDLHRIRRRAADVSELDRASSPGVLWLAIDEGVRLLY